MEQGRQQLGKNTIILSKVQLGHPSLVDHNSQECPRQQVQQQGNEGETLRLKEITFLPLWYFQKLTSYDIYISRAVEVGKAEGAETFEGEDGHRAAEKVRNKFVLNWNMVMADIYPRKAEYQRISFITYAENIKL